VPQAPRRRSPTCYDRWADITRPGGAEVLVLSIPGARNVLLSGCPAAVLLYLPAFIWPQVPILETGVSPRRFLRFAVCSRAAQIFLLDAGRLVGAPPGPLWINDDGALPIAVRSPFPPSTPKTTSEPCGSISGPPSILRVARSGPRTTQAA